MGVIGDALSEARARRKVDLEDVHAATGIRARYLQAIEDEDWGVLPEEFYVRAFIRKYAQFLGVAPEPLVEEYRRQQGTAGRGEAPTSPFARTTSRRAEALRRRRRRQEIYTWIGAAVLLAAIVVAVVLLTSGGGGDEAAGGHGGKGAGARGRGPGGAAKHARGKGGAQGGAASGGKGKAAKGVTLQIEPTAEVWACVENASGRRLVDAQTLKTGETVGPFRSRSYIAAFGNGSVHVTVDGASVRTPSTSPMGFTVDSHGKLHDLPEGKRPSCE